MEILHYWWAVISMVLTVLACVLAFWQGGNNERLGATILISAWAISIVLSVVHPKAYYNFDWEIATIDILTLLGFVIVSLRSRRLWTLLASGFQLNAVMSHFGIMLAPHAGGVSYITSAEFWTSYPVVLALAFGIWEHQKCLKLGIA
jgi:hypothetical protein